jgi:hypothetical protein
MNPAADADAEAVLDAEREALKLRLVCEACGVALSVGPEQRGELDRLRQAHLRTAGERYGTPCSEETLRSERVYTDGSAEAI